MDQEQRLLEALRQVASAEFENDLLILRDVAGEQLVRGGRIN
jgi:heat shock protein HslJ